MKKADEQFVKQLCQQFDDVEEYELLCKYLEFKEEGDM
jgi:hypothetical protein